MKVKENWQNADNANNKIRWWEWESSFYYSLYLYACLRFSIEKIFLKMLDKIVIFISYMIFILSSLKIPCISLLSNFTEKTLEVSRTLLKKIQKKKKIQNSLVLLFSISTEKTTCLKTNFLWENSVTAVKQ